MDRNVEETSFKRLMTGHRPFPRPGQFKAAHAGNRLRTLPVGTGYCVYIENVRTPWLLFRNCSFYGGLEAFRASNVSHIWIDNCYVFNASNCGIYLEGNLASPGVEISVSNTVVEEGGTNSLIYARYVAGTVQNVSLINGNNSGLTSL